MTLNGSNLSTSSKLPTIKELINSCDSSFREEMFNINENIVIKSEFDIDTNQEDTMEVDDGQSLIAKLEHMIDRNVDFMNDLKAMKLGELCSAIAQLCHMDSSLAEKVWLVLFPAIWESLNSTQKTVNISYKLSCLYL